MAIFLVLLVTLAACLWISGKTNRGKFHLFDVYYRNASEPTTFFFALFSDAATPGADTNTKSELTEVVNGFGYVTGGISLSRNSTDFDVLTEDDVNDRVLVQIRDLVWTAAGGSIGPARWGCLTDDNVTQGSRLILDYFDLVSNRIVTDGQAFTLQDCEMRGKEAA